MHPLVPEFILNHYAKGVMAGAFSAAGLFVDISGFSTMTDSLMEHGQHGAEVLADVMRATFNPLIRSVYEQGGFIISQGGDAFSALIPIRTGDHDAYRRALTAAASIRARASEMIVHQTPYGLFSISVKVGLALGETTWGIIPSADERRAAYYFRGTAVDQAAECEHIAAPGEVIVDTSLFHEIKSLAIFEPTGDHYRLLDLTCQPTLAQPAPLPMLDLEFASRFYPQDLYLQRQSGEFRHCTSLFVSLPTIRAETQLRIFMQTVFELQDHFGSLLELRFGDKGAHLLFFWGAPIAYENDIERSLNFIFELQARTTMPIHAGVTYRLAHAGFIGSEYAEEYTAYGRGVNLAARFMTAAPRGEIWVDENVARAGSKLFEFEYRGQQTFKGFAKPQKYYVLSERKDRVEYEYGGKLIGRSEEMQTLARFIQPIFSGQFAGMLTIKGDAGIGKSRLLHDFVEQLAVDHADGFQVFFAQTDEMIRKPYNPWGYWLRHHFDVRDTQSDSRNRRNFNRKLDDLIHILADAHLREELDRTRSFLGALVGLFWPDSLYEQVEAQERYENTITALNILLQAESLKKPTILWLEDIHWLDEDSKRYLPALLRAMAFGSERTYPFAILASSRVDESPLAIDGIHQPEIQLKQLNRKALALLASEQLNAPPADSLIDLLVNRSDGNPFFAEELLRYLKQNNLLDCQPDGCIVVSDQAETLPATIGALLVARLDHLVKDVREIVQTAAVIGREFDLNLLMSMLPGVEKMAEYVHQAIDAAIWRALSETRYIFRHTLMRDSAYSMLVMARRKQLHLLAVNAIESVYPDRLEMHYSELAYHSLHAELHDKACHYYQLAAEAAEQAYQNELAIAYISQALSLTDPEALDRRFKLLLQRAHLYNRLGLVEKRKEDLTSLDQLVAQMNDRSKTITILLEKANLLLDLDLYEEAIEIASKAIEAARLLADFQQAANGYRYVGTALFRMGNYDDAVQQIQIALECASQVNDSQLRSSVLSNLGLIYLDQEKVELAAGAFTSALEVARENKQLTAQAIFLNNLAQTVGMTGNFTGAQAYFQESLAIIRKIGAKRDEGLVLGNLGWTAANLGDYRTAYDYHLANLRLNRQMGHRFIEGYAMINLSAVACALGDSVEAVQWAEQALSLTREIKNQHAEAWALTYLGHAHLAEADWDQAANAYEEAIKIRYQLNQNILASEPIAGLAQVMFNTGRVVDAAVHLEPVIALLNSGGSLEGTDEPMRIYATTYLVLDALNDTRAEPILDQGYAALQSRAAQIPNELIREQYLNHIPHNRIIYQAWGQNNRAVNSLPV